MTEEELNLETTSEEGSGETVIEVTIPEPLAVTIVDTRPVLTTPFTEYTVTEGLLLSILLVILVSKVIKFAKGCLAWLLS